MPWYWTDDLARTLIDAGTVERARVSTWLVSPVAIRSDEENGEAVARSLLTLEEDEEGDEPARPLAA